MHYEEWNQAIISYFFEDREPGEIVFLQTDDKTLSEIAELSDCNVQDASESLTLAVRGEVVQAGRRVNLWSINPTNSWANFQKKKPPQVAFLALTVLAASRMESSDSASHTNYYIQLNKLLFNESIQGIPKGIKRTEFENFWKHLQRWANDCHNVELYLTEGASSRRYVWYPMSQCLIRKHDLPVIYRFFVNDQLHPFSNPSVDQILDKLRYWYSFGTLSARIRDYLDKKHYAQLIGNQVQLLLKNWDGREIPPSPPSTRASINRPSRIDVELRFYHMSDNVEVRYWFPRRSRDEIDCEINRLGIKCLQTSGSEKWFRSVIDKGGMFWNLPNRLQLQTDETRPVIYTLDLSNIWVFRKDLERDDGWLSQRNMQLYEEHLIVFRKELTEQVIACLNQTCELGDETPNLIHDGWCYLRAKPTELLPVSNPELWRLSVDSSKQIRFIGGLSVQDLHGHRAYLNICLPAVFVPNLGFSSEVLLEVDSQEFSVDENQLVMLDGIVGPGVHQISYGTKTRELRVITPERSVEHNNQILTTALSQDVSAMPVYSVKKIAEITAESGVRFAGAQFFGTDIPEVTWDDVQTEPQIQEADSDSLFKAPAELISLVVKAAIELKQDTTSVPEWLGEALEYLDQNVALRTLVQKKLRHYHQTALSYLDLYRLEE